MKTAAPPILYDKQEVVFDSPFGELNKIGRFDLRDEAEYTKPRNHWVVETEKADGLKVLRFSPFGAPNICCKLEYRSDLDLNSNSATVEDAYHEYQAQLEMLREAHIKPLVEVVAIGDYTIGHGAPAKLDHIAPRGIFVLQPLLGSLAKLKPGSMAEILAQERHRSYARMARRRGGLLLRDLHHREQYATRYGGIATILVDSEPVMGKDCSVTGCR